MAPLNRRYALGLSVGSMLLAIIARVPGTSCAPGSPGVSAAGAAVAVEAVQPLTVDADLPLEAGHQAPSGPFASEAQMMQGSFVCQRCTRRNAGPWCPYNRIRAADDGEPLERHQSAAEGSANVEAQDLESDGPQHNQPPPVGMPLAALLLVHPDHPINFEDVKLRLDDGSEVNQTL
eukprot:GHVT01064576.1.p1 GENE.GHVT01064576.1~~GHVT01064576.1.p1  ORF type:complete len:177 (+),score=32.46 GHVT01064576.1:401-931(+)